jgi:hypothetical protein
MSAVEKLLEQPGRSAWRLVTTNAVFVATYSLLLAQSWAGLREKSRRRQ